MDVWVSGWKTRIQPHGQSERYILADQQSNASYDHDIESTVDARRYAN